ncbi:MAG: EamA family transporter [Clostridia bacterium]|nr:EamA family transporter [Clostridia bacterium]
MLFLILAIMSSSLVSIVMRIGSAKVKNNIGMLAANYMTCFLLALFYNLGQPLLPSGSDLAPTLSLGMINGVLYLASFVIFQFNVQKNGVVLSSVFMKLGLIVPLVISIAFFDEGLGLIQAIGLVLAIAAIIMINVSPEKSGKKNGFFLILLLLLSGMAEAMSKVFDEKGNSAFSTQFLLYTFVMALVLCLALLLVKKQRIGAKELLFGTLIGVPNFFSAKFILSALADIPAVIAYPTSSVATILVVSIVGVFAFRERLRKLQWVAVCFIVTALALLNM